MVEEYDSFNVNYRKLSFYIFAMFCETEDESYVILVTFMVVATNFVLFFSTPP